MNGWKCPGCGACYAPFVSACHYCMPKTEMATTTTPYTPPPSYRPETASPPPPRPENTCAA